MSYARNLLNHCPSFTLGLVWVLSVQIVDVDNPYLPRGGYWSWYKITSCSLPVDYSNLGSRESTFWPKFIFISPIEHGIFFSWVKGCSNIWGFCWIYQAVTHPDACFNWICWRRCDTKFTQDKGNIVLCWSNNSWYTSESWYLCWFSVSDDSIKKE